MAKFSDVLIIKNGKNQKAVENPNGKYPIYGSGGIMGYADDYICNPNTVIIGRKGSINNPIYVDTPFWNVDTAFGLEADIEKLSPRYLYYFCVCFDFERLNTTVTIPSLTKQNLLKIDIPLPPLETQCKIAANLDKVTRTIDLCNAILEKLDLLVKSRFVEMFGDIIRNTKQWDIHIFSDITTSRLGKMLDAKKQTGENAFPYLANFNVQWFRFELDNLNTMDFDAKDQAEFSLEEDDLLVCEGGEIGRCAIWHNEVSPCYFQKALHRVRCNKEIIMPTYLAWWFRFNCDNNGFSEIEGAKATIAHLPGAKLKKLPVVVPPLALQEQFAAFVEQTDKSKLAVKQVLEKAETLKKALMQEYFG